MVVDFSSCWGIRVAENQPWPGVNPADVSVWLADSFDPDVEGRSDYNGTNSVTPADLSLLLGVALGGGSTQSATAYCD